VEMPRSMLRSVLRSVHGCSDQCRCSDQCMCVYGCGCGCVCVCCVCVSVCVRVGACVFCVSADAQINADAQSHAQISTQISAQMLRAVHNCSDQWRPAVTDAAAVCVRKFGTTQTWPAVAEPAAEWYTYDAPHDHRCVCMSK
jgi:hypothetical protein